MTVASAMTSNGISLRRSLQYGGISRKRWYYTSKPREIPVNHTIAQAVQKEASARPTYGTRRMAAMLSRHLGRPVNRKQVQRIYRRLGWIVPRKTKSEIIRSAKKLLRPTAPDKLWEADMTYIWCGSDRWCYLFNVIDVFTREWIGYAFDVAATRHNAVMSVNNAVASRKPHTDELVIRVDNGSQYISNDFQKSVKILGAGLEFIYYHTPEQNGHIESFHKTLKKEYLWPHDFQNYQEAEVVIMESFDDYNNRRIHSALGYRTPREFCRLWEMKNK
ncbi:MAG: IS3 family transposase [Rhabdochlamydiaceae bacterium]